MPLELPIREPCPFCENLKPKIATDSMHTKSAAFIERLDLASAFVNPYQHRHGAVLVIPNRHAPSILDLTEREAESLARLVRRVAHAVHDAFDPVGLNVFQNNGIASGQRVPHYHVHVVPRYPGDRPEILLGKDAVLITFEERVRMAEQIAGHLLSGG
jgi:histidine triad (HIT) family protein